MQKYLKLKLFFVTIFIDTLFINSTYSIRAHDDIFMSSATIQSNQLDNEFDPRIIILKNFFEKYNSPLTEHAVVFVESADTYGLDWRLLPAITGVESTFGKRIPYNSYNAYGWNNGNYYFDSWNDSINHVSKALRENYLNDGLTSVDQIAKRYAASPDWAWKVKYFQNEIDPLPLEFTL
jgi:hypothetical protein